MGLLGGLIKAGAKVATTGVKAAACVTPVGAATFVAKEVVKHKVKKELKKMWDEA